jgi:transcriptional regulator with XRE-family HTH domain
MTSFRISLTPSKRVAGRFVSSVRRAIQKALAEEQRDSGLTQSDIARKIGVHRSVINRQIQGREDMTLSRVAELAWALGRKPVFDLPKISRPHGSNLPRPDVVVKSTQGSVRIPPDQMLQSPATPSSREKQM